MILHSFEILLNSFAFYVKKLIFSLYICEQLHSQLLEEWVHAVPVVSDDAAHPAVTEVLAAVIFFWESFHGFVVILNPQFWTIWLEY